MEPDGSDVLAIDVVQASRCCHSEPPVAQRSPPRISQIGRRCFRRKDLALKRPKTTQGGWVVSPGRPVVRWSASPPGSYLNDSVRRAVR